MTVPTYSAMELAIRSAWAGDLPAARALVDDDGLQLGLEQLANAPFAYKNVSADGVRAAWVRAGGVVPVTPTGGISTPLDAPAAWPYR